jgi:hypothetical protein
LAHCSSSQQKTFAAFASFQAAFAEGNQEAQMQRSLTVSYDLRRIDVSKAMASMADTMP